jgi:hypothetical protein
MALRNSPLQESKGSQGQQKERQQRPRAGKGGSDTISFGMEKVRSLY